MCSTEVDEERNNCLRVGGGSAVQCSAGYEADGGGSGKVEQTTGGKEWFDFWEWK
jgi:hypothetical protein